MPKVSDEARARVIARRAFINPDAWRRSARGNYWRQWEGLTVTLYRRDDRWGWCIADADGPRFSDGLMDSIEDARADAGALLGLQD